MHAYGARIILSMTFVYPPRGNN